MSLALDAEDLFDDVSDSSSSIEIVALAETEDFAPPASHDGSSPFDPLSPRPNKPLPSPPPPERWRTTTSASSTSPPPQRSPSAAASALPASTGSIPNVRPQSQPEVMIGARRGKTIEDQLAALRTENAKLREVQQKLVQREAKNKKMKEKVAARFTALLNANRQQSSGAVHDASVEVARVHHMTLSILQQYRDYTHEAETKLLVVERERAIVETELAYLRARVTQTEELTKCVLMHAKEHGLLGEQSPLTQLVKTTREQFAVPKRPTEEDTAQRYAEAREVKDSELSRWQALAERVRDFERFLELRKQQQQGSATTASVVPSATPVGPPLLSLEATEATTRENRSLSLAQGVKAMQIFGLEPRSARRRESGAAILVDGRKTPSDFPYFEWATVRHVQKLISVLDTRATSSTAQRKATPQSDALREEANKATPNVEWIVGELVQFFGGGGGLAASRAAVGWKRTASASSMSSALHGPYRLDPEWRTDRGRSLLHVIVECDAAAKVLEDLVKIGFSPSEQDECGLTAFHVACMHSAACVSKLLKINPKFVNHKVLDDLSPLHLAALKGNVAICKALLENNANAEPDRNGASPLVYALLNDKAAMATFLAERVVGLVHQCDGEGNSPLHFACCVAGREVAHDLLRCGADVNAVNRLGTVALWIGLQSDDAALVQTLIATPKVDVNQALGPHRLTLLHMACLFLTPARVCWALTSLIGRGANVSAANDEQKTALYFAVVMDRNDAIRLLLDAGADANAKDCAFNRPLHFAQSVEAVTTLVAGGARINVRNRAGNTPLHVACALGNRAVAQVLVDSGASDAAENEAGEQPSDMAKYEARVALPFYGSDVSSAATGGIVLYEQAK